QFFIQNNLKLVRIARLGRAPEFPVERRLSLKPELLVYSQYRNATHMNLWDGFQIRPASRIGSPSSGSLQQNGGTCMFCLQPVRQFLADEMLADQDVVHPAELADRQVAQAASQGIADEQSAG